MDICNKEKSAQSFNDNERLFTVMNVIYICYDNVDDIISIHNKAK